MRPGATLVTGGTGFVGRFVVEALIASGRSVRVAGRTPPPPGFFSAPVAFVPLELDPASDMTAVVAGCEVLVHAAFDHVADRYRGGEGTDPDGFRRRNLDGSVALFRAAKSAGVRRVVFLSSRAAYGSWPPGTSLSEDLPARPDTLYGAVKLEAETALASLCDERFNGVSARVTGVYGPAAPGRSHKWHGLFADFAAGAAVSPRIATEVHGDDVAQAVLALVNADAAYVRGRVFNVSDIALDRRDLLALYREHSGADGRLPDRADPAAVNAMTTDRLRALGWRPGGMERLSASMPLLVAGGEAAAIRDVRAQ